MQLPPPTARIQFHALAPTDDAFILELLNAPGFLANIGDRGVRDLGKARDYIAQGPATGYARHGFGLWKICLREDGAPVGMCGLLQRDELPFPDLGYALLPKYESQGLATEAGRAALDHGFHALGMTRILAIVAPRNGGSRAVLGKLGMHETGEIVKDGKPLLVYGLDRSP
jgi:[ribosomal protein S5]-alanine N-acetyltransferase